MIPGVWSWSQTKICSIIWTVHLGLQHIVSDVIFFLIKKWHLPKDMCSRSWPDPGFCKGWESSDRCCRRGCIPVPSSPSHSAIGRTHWRRPLCSLLFPSTLNMHLLQPLSLADPSWSGPGVVLEWEVGRGVGMEEEVMCYCAEGLWDGDSYLIWKFKKKSPAAAFPLWTEKGVQLHHWTTSASTPAFV